ncbi:hypothetical protein GCM10009740_37090 [Terrabacter terrae]|uniref:Uncharacterized protein n=1 Tax=Terrabacter terrae TaxID=318434 RepID=A0ABP5G8G5_9MICO
MSALPTAVSSSGASIGFYIVGSVAAVIGILMIVFRGRVTDMVDRLSGRDDREGWRPSAGFQAAFGVGFLLIAVVMVFLAQAARG